MKIRFRFVTNHWGWTWRGVRTWIRYGWGFFARWGIENIGRPETRCCKLGPFVLVRED